MSDFTRAWNGDPVDCSGGRDGYLSVTGLSGGDTITVNSSLTGGGFSPCSVVALADFSELATITADGDYTFPVAGFVSFTQTGSASEPTVDLLVK
jgi:hypothetical protein